MQYKKMTRTVNAKIEMWVMRIWVWIMDRIK